MKNLIGLTAALAFVVVPAAAGVATASPLDPVDLTPLYDEHTCYIQAADNDLDTIAIAWPDWYFTEGSVEGVTGGTSGGGPLPCFPKACPAPYSLGSDGCYTVPAVSDYPPSDDMVTLIFVMPQTVDEDPNLLPFEDWFPQLEGTTDCGWMQWDIGPRVGAPDPSAPDSPGGVKLVPGELARLAPGWLVDSGFVLVTTGCEPDVTTTTVCAAPQCPPVSYPPPDTIDPDACIAPQCPTVSYPPPDTIDPDACIAPQCPTTTEPETTTTWPDTTTVTTVTSSTSSTTSAPNISTSTSHAPTTTASDTTSTSSPTTSLPTSSTPPLTNLPATGSTPIGSQVAVCVVLLALGVALSALARRRR